MVELRPVDNKTRENIILAKQRKEKRKHIAQWLNVSISTIDKVWHKYQQQGTYHPKPYPGGKGKLTPQQKQAIETTITQTPNITLLTLIDQLSLDISESALSRNLKIIGLTFKKRCSMQTVKNAPMSLRSAKNGATTKQT